MKTNILLFTMVGLTIVLQLTGLYRQQPKATAAARVQDAPPNTLIDLEGLPTKGLAGAKVVVVEFSDYECPFCAVHANGAAKDLEREFVDTGKVRLAFVNNPLPIHSSAKLLATAAICAGDQNRYWEMHDRLFKDAGKIEGDALFLMAQSFGLDKKQFTDCIGASSRASAKISEDQQKARDLKLNGTPAFAIAIAKGGQPAEVKKLILGAQTFEVFERAIQQVITEAKS